MAAFWWPERVTFFVPVYVALGHRPWNNYEGCPQFRQFWLNETDLLCREFEREFRVIDGLVTL